MKDFSLNLGQDISASTALFDFVSDAVFLMKKDADSFRYVYANPSGLALLPCQNVIGKRIEEVLSPAQSQKVIHYHQQALSAKHSVEFIDSIDAEHGEFIGETVLNPICSEEGDCRYILSIIRDVTEYKYAYKELTETKENLEVFWNNSTDPIFFIDTKGDILKVNPAFEETFGFTEEEMVSGKGTIIPPGMMSDQIDIVERLLNGESVNSHDTLRIAKSGEKLNIISSYSPVRNSEKEIVGATIIYKNVTELKRAEQELQKSQEKYKLITESTFDIITWINPSQQIEYQSPAFEEILGYSCEDCIGSPFTDYVHSDDVHILTDSVASLLSGGTSTTVEVRFLHKNGQYIWMEVSPTPVLENGEVTSFFTIARDITERRRLRDKIAKMAFFDHLTAIPNRRTFDNHLQKALVHAKSSGKKVAVLMLDGHKFKEINDQFGHDAGDAVIKEMAERLQSCVGPAGTAARLGGDEMGVILPAIDSVEAAVDMAKRILASFDVPLTYNGIDIPIGAGIGISIYPDDVDTEKLLVKNADLALYEAKKSGRNNYRVYNKDQ